MGKKVQDHETPASITTDVNLVRYEPFNEDVIKEILSEQFYTVYTNSAIGKDLYSIDRNIYQQILEKKNEVIVVPEEMLTTRKMFFELTLRIFPNFESEKILMLSDDTALTLLALSG